MTLSKAEARRRLAVIVRNEMARVAPKGPYGRLKKSMRIVPAGRGYIVYSLYYWARWVNDGRREVSGKRMIFYRDARDDPRVRGDYPRRRVQVRKLTRRQYLRDKRAGKLVETYAVKAIPPTRFVEKSLQTSRKTARKEIRELIARDVRRMISRARDRSIQVRI